MLDTLNSGTSTFNRSSSEYKNMRNLLKDLVDHPGENEAEKLKAIRENHKRYLENHEKKFFKSSTAMKRKACVDAITDTLNKCYMDARAYSVREQHLITPEKAKKDLTKTFFDIEIEMLNAAASKDEMQDFYAKKRQYGITYNKTQKLLVEETKEGLKSSSPNIEQKVRARQNLIDLEVKLIRDVDNYEKVANAAENYESQQNTLTKRLQSDLEVNKNNNIIVESKDNQKVNAIDKDNIMNINNVNKK